MHCHSIDILNCNKFPENLFCCEVSLHFWMSEQTEFMTSKMISSAHNYLMLWYTEIYSEFGIIYLNILCSKFYLLAAINIKV